MSLTSAGKQNGFAIKSSFRRSVCHPGLLTSDQFVPAALSFRLLLLPLCSRPQPRWISAESLTASTVLLKGQHSLIMFRVDPFPIHQTQGNTWTKTIGLEDSGASKRFDVQYFVNNLFFFFLTNSSDTKVSESSAFRTEHMNSIIGTEQLA